VSNCPENLVQPAIAHLNDIFYIKGNEVAHVYAFNPVSEIWRRLNYRLGEPGAVMYAKTDSIMCLSTTTFVEFNEHQVLWTQETEQIEDSEQFCCKDRPIRRNDIIYFSGEWAVYKFDADKPTRVNE
jgi:hypothetical protein